MRRLCVFVCLWPRVHGPWLQSPRMPLRNWLVGAVMWPCAYFLSPLWFSPWLCRITRAWTRHSSLSLFGNIKQDPLMSSAGLALPVLQTSTPPMWCALIEVCSRHCINGYFLNILLCVGSCNAKDSTCTCDPPFTGVACQLMRCPYSKNKLGVSL